MHAGLKLGQPRYRCEAGTCRLLRYASFLQEPEKRTDWPELDTYKRGLTNQLRDDCKALMRLLYIEDCSAAGIRPHKRSVRRFC